ncbi:MAG: class I SAM-dependent methyltransferase [Spirochaetota bacterium]
MKKSLNQIIDIQDIDWNEIFKKQKAKQQYKRHRHREYWNKRAPSFADNAAKSAYPTEFIKIMKPRRSWTVLDMGCGGGTLAIPLAGKVKEITAVDFSDKMIEILSEEATKRGFQNIKTIKASWEDDWGKAGIGVYDVAIASRSLAVEDIKAAIIKLDKAARKRVYLSTVAGDGPFDRNIFEAIGRKYVPYPDYLYVYNVIYQMGIRARIDFIIQKNVTKIYDSYEAGLNSYKWMFQDLTKPEEKKLQKFLHDHLVNASGKWTLDYKQKVTWAVIWWDKEN